MIATQTIASSASITISHEITTLSQDSTTNTHESITTSRDISPKNKNALFQPITPSRDFSLENENALFQPIIPGAIYFPIYSVTMEYKNRELKKKIGFPDEWTEIEVSDPHHPLRAIQTGKRSNISVVDIDRMSSHRKLLEAIPELASVRTVKTRKGFHLFFTYDPRLKNATDCFTLPDIDIRSDGGCVLAPPTTYVYEGMVCGYEDMGGVVGPVPEALYEFMRPDAFKDDDPVAIAAYTAMFHGSSMETMDEEEKAVVVGQVQQLVSLLSPERARPYGTWSEVGFAIHQELALEGLELFLEFSSKAGSAYDRVGCISFYRKLRPRAGRRLTMGSLCYWAKQDSPVEYAAYRTKYPIMPVEPVEEDVASVVSESNTAPMEKGVLASPRGPRTVANDWGAGLLIYSELAQTLVYSCGSFYFKKGHLWIQNEEEIRSAIRVHVMKAALYKTNAKKELLEYSQTYKNACNITQCVLDQVMIRRDDDWVRTLFSSSLGFVLFTNGYMDCKGCRFVPMDSPEFDDSIRFTEIIPFDYDTTDCPEAVARVRQVLFTDPFGDRVGSYYALMLARGLAGDCMKKFLLGVGPADTGKSMLTSVLRECCGGYVDGWNAGNLTERQSSQDEAQQLRWLLLLRTKRIIVSNELKTRHTLDGNMIKKMSNGGLDTLSGREHRGNETPFQIGCLPILYSQDVPRITPMDDAIMTRVRAIPYEKVYVDCVTNSLELKKDPGLSEEIKTHAFRQGFLHLLFDAYTRFHQGGRVEVDLEEIKEAVLAVVGTETTILEAFKSRFEITNDPAHYVLSSEMKTWLTDGKYGVSDTKLGMELKRYAQIQGLENVFNKNKKINRKIVVVWQGIQVHSDIEEEH